MDLDTTTRTQSILIVGGFTSIGLAIAESIVRLSPPNQQTNICLFGFLPRKEPGLEAENP